MGRAAASVGPDVHVTRRYQLLWRLNRFIVRLLFDVRAAGIDDLPQAPYELVCNHHNGIDPMLVMAVTPLEPRITWFGPKEADPRRGFKNHVMAFFGGVIPYHPEKTTLTSATRSVRRVFDSGGVLGIFAEGKVGFREAELLSFEDGAASFAALSKVPIVPCAIVGTSRLWLRRRLVVRFGTALSTDAGRDRAARAALERQLVDAVAALLPRREPPLPRFRPLERLLTDLLNGPEDVAARRRLAAADRRGG